MSNHTDNNKSNHGKSNPPYTMEDVEKAVRNAIVNDEEVISKIEEIIYKINNNNRRNGFLDSLKKNILSYFMRKREETRADIELKALKQHFDDLKANERRRKALQLTIMVSFLLVFSLFLISFIVVFVYEFFPNVDLNHVGLEWMGDFKEHGVGISYHLLLFPFFMGSMALALIGISKSMVVHSSRASIFKEGYFNNKRNESSLEVESPGSAGKAYQEDFRREGNSVFISEALIKDLSKFLHDILKDVLKTDRQK